MDSLAPPFYMRLVRHILAELETHESLRGEEGQIELMGIKSAIRNMEYNFEQHKCNVKRRAR